MPRPPHFSPALDELPGTVYSTASAARRSGTQEFFPLNVGDTWMEPPPGCHMEDLRTEEIPGLHRYAPVEGLPGLVDAIVERARTRTGVLEERRNVLITQGATGGLAAVLGALIAPGDEVIVLAPHWPLVGGMISAFHGKPVRVSTLSCDTPDSWVSQVLAHASNRTIALYLNTPCNPTGRVIPRSVVEALVQLARQQGWWILSDEVYEDYVYEGEHTYARPLAPERTFSAYSFSKAYGMAGNRCGYVLGPSEAMAQVSKVSTHSFYSAPTASQWAALRALRGPGDAWVKSAAAQYRSVGNEAAARLGVERPQGGTFLFFDVAAHLGEGGLSAWLERCADKGVLIAPGTSFGPFPTFVRLCFTSAAPPLVLRGVDLLATLMR
jgi:aspartate/methionine/tyrosine aminotransferase